MLPTENEVVTIQSKLIRLLTAHQQESPQPGYLPPDEDSGDNVLDEGIAEAQAFVKQFLDEIGRN